MKIALYFFVVGALALNPTYSQDVRCQQIVEELREASILRRLTFDRFSEFALRWPTGGIKVTLSFRAHDSAALDRQRFEQSLPKSIRIQDFDFRKKGAPVVEKRAKLQISTVNDFEALLTKIRSSQPIVISATKSSAPSTSASVAEDFKVSIRKVRGFGIQSVSVRGNTIYVKAIGLAGPGAPADPFPKTFRSASGVTYTVKLTISAARG